MPLEIRQVSPSLFLGKDKDQGQELVWMRIRPDDAELLEQFYASNKRWSNSTQQQMVQRALLAFACDQYAFSPALRKGGLSWLIRGCNYASLDHTMYWHRDVDLTQWHLFAGHSPAAASARGLGVNYVFDQQGNVVSTFLQEGMIRV
jgi:acyl-CoA thioesterase-2